MNTGTPAQWLDRCHIGDCRALMRSMHEAGVQVQTCITSPPYFGLRDYGHPGQLGLEATPGAYVEAMIEVFRCVRNILADDGTLWLNIGDSYGAGGDTHTGFNMRYSGTASPGNKQDAMLDGIKGRKVNTGLRAKNLLGIPWRIAFALQADGWILRQEIIWHKPNPMPESVTDRCTKAHESIFLLAKQDCYYFDADAMREPCTKIYSTSKDYGGFVKKDRLKRQRAESHMLHASRQDSDWTPDRGRNRRSVWTIATSPYNGAHFAVFPEALIEPCVMAGSKAGSIVLDPFFGSGTTGAVAQRLGRHFIGCEINADYVRLQDDRTRQPAFIFEGDQA